MIEQIDIVNGAPLPWNTLEVGTHGSGGYHLYITDAKGRKIAAVWGKPEEKAYTGSLIVSAANALHRQSMPETRLRACLAFLEATAEQNRQLRPAVPAAGESAELFDDAAGAIRELLILRAKEEA